MSDTQQTLLLYAVILCGGIFSVCKCFLCQQECLLSGSFSKCRSDIASVLTKAFVFSLGTLGKSAIQLDKEPAHWPLLEAFLVLEMFFSFIMDCKEHLTVNGPHQLYFQCRLSNVSFLMCFPYCYAAIGCHILIQIYRPCKLAHVAVPITMNI